MRNFKVWMAGFVCLMILGSGSAHAQATRTWVSGVGDDANPCSRTAPCKTFAGAISKTAAGGEINALDPGGFGTVTITKAITIDGGNGNMAGVLAFGANGITVAALAEDVVFLRNLDINGGTPASGSLSGIRFISGKRLYVENSTIYNFATGIEFVPNAPASLSIDRTFVRENSGAGLYVDGSVGKALVTVVGSRFENNQYGVKTQGRTEVTIRDSVANRNTINGFMCVTATDAANMNLENSAAVNNINCGIVAKGAAATVRISNTLSSNNACGVATYFGGDLASFGNNHISGNTTDGAPTSLISPQ